MTKRIEPLGIFFKKITKTNLLACGDPPSLRWSRGPQRNLLGECLRGYTNLNGPRILAKFCKSKSDSEPDSDESSPSNRLFDEFVELLRDGEPEAEPATAAEDDKVWPCKVPSYICRHRILGSRDKGSGLGRPPNSTYPRDADDGLEIKKFD